jgi:hypothetical protein
MWFIPVSDHPDVILQILIQLGFGVRKSQFTPQYGDLLRLSG